VAVSLPISWNAVVSTYESGRAIRRAVHSPARERRERCPGGIDSSQGRQISRARPAARIHASAHWCQFRVEASLL